MGYVDTDAIFAAMREVVGGKSDTELMLDADTKARLEGAIAREMETLHVRDEAKRRHAAKSAESVELPKSYTGQDFLSVDFGEEQWLVEGLIPTDSRVLFLAQRKAGKTTMMLNLLRSLLDRDDFLNYFPVTDYRRVSLIDFELSDRNLQRWLRSQSIHGIGALDVIPSRGRASALNVLDDRTRARWAQRLGDFGTETLIVDPIGPVARALGLDENTELGILMDAIGELKHEAGISEVVMVHHMGWDDSHGRGDSKQEDIPDAIVRLTTDDMNDLRAFHYLSAMGRDVDVPKGLVTMREGNRLSFTAEVGAGKDDRYVSRIVEAIEQEGELTSGAIVALGITGVNKNTISGLLTKAVGSGALEERREGTSKFYSVPRSNVTEGQFGQAA